MGATDHHKTKLADAFGGHGHRLIHVAEMRHHFDQLAKRRLGIIKYNLVKSANPCSNFDTRRLAPILKPQADGSLGLFTTAKAGEPLNEQNAYFHSTALLLIFNTALEQVRVPATLEGLRLSVVNLAIDAHKLSRCHAAHAKSGRLRPVEKHELG